MACKRSAEVMDVVLLMNLGTLIRSTDLMAWRLHAWRVLRTLQRAFSIGSYFVRTNTNEDLGSD